MSAAGEPPASMGDGGDAHNADGGGGRGRLGSWRFASRLARREVQRRPGRTLLVVLLIAVPVMAMTVADVVARTNDAEEHFDRQWPAGTDIVIAGPVDGTLDLGDALPAGTSKTEVVHTYWAPIQLDDQRLIANVEIVGTGIEPGASSRMSLSRGRPPRPGEVWVSEPLLRDLGANVGDTITLQHPRGSWVVAGTGRYRNHLGSRGFVMPDLPEEQFRRSALERLTLIDLPGRPAPAETAELLSSFLDLEGDMFGDVAAEGADVEIPRGSHVMWRGHDHEWRESTTTRMAWGWVAGAIALAATGIIVAAAFATSARRQLVTIGLLSANGGSEALLRRTLALQGLWTGVLGTGVGMGVGLLALWPGHGVLERMQGHAVAGYRFVVPDLLAIAATGIAAATIAALVPARTAAKVPITAALAGRRPIGRVPRRLVPIGAALFAGGVFLLVVAASSGREDRHDVGNPIVAAAVLGGLLVLAGTCCCSPLAVDAMSRTGATVGRAWRFAGRSLARTRTRTAAVVTAVAVAGSIAVAGSSLSLNLDDTRWQSSIPANVAAVLPEPGWLVDEERPADEGHPREGAVVDQRLREGMQAAVPDSTWHTRRVATYEPARRSSPRTDRVDDPGLIRHGDDQTTGTLVVADPILVDLYRLSEADRAALESGRVLVVDPWLLAPGEHLPELPEELTLLLSTAQGDLRLPAAASERAAADLSHLGSGPGMWVTSTPLEGDNAAFLVSEATVRDTGLDIVASGGFLQSDSALTRSDADSLSAVVYERPGLNSYYRDAPSSRRSDSVQNWVLRYDWDRFDWRYSSSMLQGAALAAAMLLTLLIVAIGLSLAATESREERDVLAAIGARPATMRQMAGAKAVMITVVGAVLAIPTGLLPLAAVLRTLDRPFHVPWMAIGGLLIVIPFIAGLSAWAASSIAQRARPVQMSNLAVD